MKISEAWRPRRKRAFIGCLLVVLGFAYLFPYLHYLLQDAVLQRAYANHVAPQIGSELVSTSTRLLPRLKDDAVRDGLDSTKPAVFLVGNSHQFQKSRQEFERAFGCSISNYYNMSYPGADTVDANFMLRRHAERLAPGGTVLMAVLPEIFILAARIWVPSINHPWSGPELWWRNIRDGNASLSSLYPRLLSIRWPNRWDTNFPFVSYYRDLLTFLNNGFAEVDVMPDGTVAPVLFERENTKRVERGETLVFDRTSFAKEASSPLNPLNFEKFVETISTLTSRGLNIVAFESVFHPSYEQLRKNPGRTAAYKKFMEKLDRKYPAFHYVPRERTWVEVPDALWLDHSHVTKTGEKFIVDQLGAVIDRKFVCLEPTS